MRGAALATLLVVRVLVVLDAERVLELEGRLALRLLVATLLFGLLLRLAVLRSVLEPLDGLRAGSLSRAGGATLTGVRLSLLDRS